MAVGRTHAQEGIVAAITPFANNHTALAPGDSRFVDVAELPWQKARFAGVEFKTLLIDEATGLLTTLMRMAPGASLPDHEHVRIEQTYVLEGRLVDDDGEMVMRAGDIASFPRGVENGHHFQNRSAEDCVMLAISAGDEGDSGSYPDIDMQFGPRGFTRKDGSTFD